MLFTKNELSKKMNKIEFTELKSDNYHEGRHKDAGKVPIAAYTKISPKPCLRVPCNSV